MGYCVTGVRALEMVVKHQGLSWAAEAGKGKVCDVGEWKYRIGKDGASAVCITADGEY